ncbi:uncharacterized protein LOC131243061 [Magnolia sinica]|uniref:uncharacterized protein LOC131243061 n=1 Tax=Magnolia sinica TaxID=86752 RepID=UPI00265A4BAB|nr:uncharacterized protein LOC131243061 [Magnolia sinica]XP_058098109.1 uncharacterized protein LOC131243061 [Magnolia sinica]XP_058098110.1 uncharacterized protein LOC131243061 [Magnolia sinica]XP_058098111.1 uncharacterized protein LOC131243061 [Magnolia sinica]XP_058098112.1 uncharacterized protein LOC131243061 [Magnolia sinica]XP_058098113.1 uncharacterized protein LOC131243061 [Magnolia sinica]
MQILYICAKKTRRGEKNMSDPYERVKGGKLTFKGGGGLAPLKSINKNKKKKKNKKPEELPEESIDGGDVPSKDGPGESDGVGDIYTIDAAKRMKYDELFPVEAKKFGYEPRSTSRSVEEALDDRVKKKADRYCK